MRAFAALVLLALAATALPFGPTLPAVAAEAAAMPVRITELLPNPDPAQGQREFVELHNAGNASVDLAGWRLHDMATASGSRNEFTFPALALPAGGRIVVWSNGSGDARGPSWSSSASKAVWNDAGDAVTLLDPSGTIAGWFAYGSAAEAAPDGFAMAKPAAPPRGRALAWEEGAWAAAVPSPGFAPGVTGGMAMLQVLNVAPTVALLGLPATAKPGEAVDVELSLADGNGPGDLVAWSLVIDGAIVVSGPSGGVAGSTAYRAVAPAVAGPWTFAATVTDAGGLAGHATATVQVRDARLSLQLPGGALRFPDLRPAARDVAALGWGTLRNEGTQAVVPLIDVSPFTGPSSFGVDGRLAIGMRAPGGNETTWVAYAGPLTALPELAPGATVEMTLRLAEVPAPLAAGAYGTTFAVVAA